MKDLSNVGPFKDRTKTPGRGRWDKFTKQLARIELYFMDEVAHIQESYSFFEKFTFIHLFTHFNIDKEIISLISA